MWGKKEDVGSCRCIHNKLIVLDFPWGLLKYWTWWCKIRQAVECLWPPLLHYIAPVWKRAFSVFGWIYNQVTHCLVLGVRDCLPACLPSSRSCLLQITQGTSSCSSRIEWIRESVLGFWDIVNGNSVLPTREIIKKWILTHTNTLYIVCIEEGVFNNIFCNATLDINFHWLFMYEYIKSRMPD
jgi:hypothetical protein